MYADGTHELVMDFDEKGNPIKQLTIDYLNVSREKFKNLSSVDKKKSVISTMKPIGQKEESQMSLEESLGKIIGKDTALKMLRSGLLNNGTQLQELLKMSEQEAAGVRYGKSIKNFTLNDKKIQEAIGSALLNQKGTKNSASLTSLGNLSFQITDRLLHGNILPEMNNEGYFDYSMVNAAVLRDLDSYKSLMNQGSNDPNQGLDRITYTKFDLNYKQIATMTVDRYQTVDNYTINGSDQPFMHSVYGSIQGNTIAPGVFNMQYFDGSSFKHDVLVINNATTISGTVINNFGQDSTLKGWSARWLEHDNNAGDSINVWSNGCFVTTTDHQYQVLQTLKDWGLQRGYQIRTRLYEWDY
jgi:hypothetical protein